MTQSGEYDFRRLWRLARIAGGLSVVAVVVNLYYGLTAPRRRAEAVALQAAARPNPQDQEIRLLQTQIAAQPKNQSARLRLAELYAGSRDFPRALAELAFLRKADPKNDDFRLKEAVVLKLAGRSQEAEVSVRDIVRRRPEHTAAREWLGETLLDQQRAHEAEDVFSECLRRRPTSPFALLGLARAREIRLQGLEPVDIATVIEPVEKAVKLAPSWAEAVSALARMKFTYLRKSDEAEKLALRAAELTPGQLQPYLVLAEIALARPPTPQNLDRAAEWIYKAGAANLGDPRPPYQMGRLCLLQNNPQRAIQALGHSLSLGPMPETVAQLAVACRRAGDSREAERYARMHQEYTDRMEERNQLLTELRRAPRQVDNYYKMAAFYLKVAQPAHAVAWVEEIERIRPGDRRAAELRARASALQAKPDAPAALPIP